MNDSLLIFLMPLIYVIILLGILYYDLNQRRILNRIALPATSLALLVSFIHGKEFMITTVLGAVLGFIFFYLLYWVGRWRYGPGALGMGDVKLAMLLGAMLGLQQIFLALALGLLFLGFAAIILLVSGMAKRSSKLPFGAYLASAGIIILLRNILQVSIP